MNFLVMFSLVVEPPPLKNIIVKTGWFPQLGLKINSNLSCHHPVMVETNHYLTIPKHGSPGVREFSQKPRLFLAAKSSTKLPTDPFCLSQGGNFIWYHFICNDTYIYNI